MQKKKKGKGEWVFLSSEKLNNCPNLKGVWEGKIQLTSNR